MYECWLLLFAGYVLSVSAGFSRYDELDLVPRREILEVSKVKQLHKSKAV